MVNLSTKFGHKLERYETGVGYGGYQYCPLCKGDNYSKGLKFNEICPAKAIEASEAERLGKGIFGTTETLVAKLLWYDRKGDEDLTKAMIEKAFKEGLVTVEEVVECFAQELKKGVKGYEVN